MLKPHLELFDHKTQLYIILATFNNIDADIKVTETLFAIFKYLSRRLVYRGFLLK